MGTYKGSCFCGAVQFTVTGEPAAMGYCHCSSCRHWSAGPVNAFTLWKPDAVKFTQGADKIGTYNKTPTSSRKSSAVGWAGKPNISGIAHANVGVHCVHRQPTMRYGGKGQIFHYDILRLCAS